MTLGLTKTRQILVFQYFQLLSVWIWYEEIQIFFLLLAIVLKQTEQVHIQPATCPDTIPFIFTHSFLLFAAIHYKNTIQQLTHIKIHNTNLPPFPHTLRSLCPAMNAAIQRQCEQKAIHNGGCHLSHKLSIKKLEFTVHLSHEMSLITLQSPAYSTEVLLCLTHYPIQASHDLQSPAWPDPGRRRSA